MDDESEGGDSEESVSSSEDDSDNEEAIVTADTLPAGPVAVNLPDTFRYLVCARTQLFMRMHNF